MIRASSRTINCADNVIRSFRLIRNEFSVRIWTVWIWRRHNPCKEANESMRRKLRVNWYAILKYAEVGRKLIGKQTKKNGRKAVGENDDNDDDDGEIMKPIEM